MQRIDRAKGRCRQVTVAVAVCALASVSLAASAQAATRTVGTTNDRGPHSLRKTIKHAHPGDTVKVPKGTYELSKGEIPIAKSLEIKGAGSTKTKISADHESRIFNVDTGISVAAAPVKIANLKLTEGKADDGGAIVNASLLKLTKVTVTDSRATAEQGSGGAISNSGTLTIDRSKLISNQAEAGGAISGGFLAGGASGPITITRSRLVKNRAVGDGFGGAIAFEPIAQPDDSGVFISQTLIAGNQALGTTAATRAYGGAIAFGVVDNEGINAPLRITRSTLSGNEAIPKGGDESFGGAVFFEPVLNSVGSVIPLTLSNSTLSGNTARGANSIGGAIFQEAVRNNGSSDKTLTNVTMVGNSAPGGNGGGIYSTAIATVFQPAFVFKDSIVAGNTSAVAGTSDCSEAVVSGGYNLEGHVSCGLVGAGDLQNTAAGVNPLANNGGPTPTRALKGSSAAVNAGNPGGCLPIDQRGVKRPQRGRCDIGAYELKP